MNLKWGFIVHLNAVVFFISYRTFLIQPVFNSFKKSESLRLVFIWIKHFSLIKKTLCLLVLKTFFFFIFLVLKLNCSFPKIYPQKCNNILRVFFHFVCLFYAFVCLFVCFCFCFCFCFCSFIFVLFVCCYFTFLWQTLRFA